MKARLTTFVRALREGYGWVSVGMIARAGLQALLVVLLARTLGPAEYGLVVAITSVTGIFALFTGIGANALHLRELSLERAEPRRSFAIAVRRNIYTFVPLMLMAVASVWLLYGSQTNATTAILLVGADFVGLSASDLMQRNLQGRRRYGDMAVYMCLLPGTRVAAVALMMLLGQSPGIHGWSVIAIASAMLPALTVAWRARHRTAVTGHDGFQWREGLGFALAAGSTRVHADADKAVVAKLSSLGDAAQYSLAYRLFDVLMLPILSFIEWRLPSLFHSGGSHRGIELLRSNKTFIAVIGGGAVLIAGLSIPVALLLPLALGSGYDQVATMAHWLALLPLTSALWWILRTLLSTSGEQTMSGSIELGGAIFNVVATLAMVAGMGWKGAVIATYTTHACMSLAALWHLLRGRNKDTA